MNRATVSVLRWVPPFAQGLVRDLRVRWALEEAGLLYHERVLGPEDQKSPQYKELQPFGQVPSLEQDGLVMFESGAIVLHLAEESPALMPSEAAARIQTRTWSFAALNTIEPPIMMLNFIDMDRETADDTKGLRNKVTQFIAGRLDVLVHRLGQEEHLVAGRFTAADLLMTTVLRALRTTDLVTSRPKLHAYQSRHEERPAFQKALSAQMATFIKNEPEG